MSVTSLTAHTTVGNSVDAITRRNRRTVFAKEGDQALGERVRKHQLGSDDEDLPNQFLHNGNQDEPDSGLSSACVAYFPPDTRLFQ